MAFNNWHDFFVACAKNKVGNKNTAVFSAAWALANTTDAKIALLTNNASTAFFAFEATNNILIVHNVRNFLGTILHPAHCFRALIGNGRFASPVIVNKASFLCHVHTAAPPCHQIIACLTRAEIDRLHHPANQQAANTFHGIALFFPAPWHLEAVSSANTSDPASLILATSEAAANFDIEPNGNPDYLANLEKQLMNVSFHCHADYLLGHIPPSYFSVYKSIIGEPSNHTPNIDLFVPASFTSPITACAARVFCPLESDYCNSRGSVSSAWVLQFALHVHCVTKCGGRCYVF
jgi:hypothetical protein